MPPAERREGAVTVDLTASSDDEDPLPVAARLLPDGKKKPTGPAKRKPAGPAAPVVATDAGKKQKKTQSAALAVPRPGVGLARASAYAGKTVVLTGVFPELGGGAGLNLGKDRARALIESFGGRVTSAVSGRTDVLLCGAEPGMSKVSQARARGVTLLNFSQLCAELGAGAPAPTKGSSEALALTENVNITSFSSGYWGNGLAHAASDAALAYAARGPERLREYPTDAKKRGRALGWS